jgi:histidinol phosphatase-like PHP family hydrolase
MIKNRVDYHTHDGFYRGSGEVWTISQGWDVAKLHNISILGISPKLESKEQEFIRFLRDELNPLKNQKILLGLEIDCRDSSGSLFLNKDNYKLLDYVMVGPHNQPAHSLAIPDLEEADYQEYFDELRNILMNSLGKNPVDIWVHPFLQELELFGAKFWPYLEPIYADILDLCQKKNITVEINANYFRSKIPDQDTASYWRAAEIYYAEKLSILKTMFTTALQEYDITFSFGSDSHHLEKVGDIDECIAFAIDLNIPNNRIKIITPK